MPILWMMRLPLLIRRSLALAVAVSFLSILPAQARWGHELDLGIRSPSGWIGIGLATRSDEPSDLIVTHRLGADGRTVFVVRLRKVFQLPGAATLGGCGGARGYEVRYRIGDVDVTEAVTGGGTTIDRMEPGHVDLRVIVRERPLRRAPLMCPVFASVFGTVHDAVTLRVVS